MEILYVISTQIYGGQGEDGEGFWTTASVSPTSFIPQILHTHLALMTYQSDA